jgi:intron-binding protein aquarius
MCIDSTLSLSIRINLLTFIVTAFQSLDSGLVRKECASLVSIGIWSNLSSEEVRNAHLEQYPQTRKAWRAAAKRFDAADDSTKTRLRFERAWLYQMVLDFLNLLYQPVEDAEDSKGRFGLSISVIGAETNRVDVLTYCERFIELLTDLESQLPTRRYVNTLLKDLHVLTAIKLSPLYASSEDGLIRDLHQLLEHFIYFSIDDIIGRPLSQEDVRQRHNAQLAKLQRIAFSDFKDKLLILALANYGNLGQRDELVGHLADLTDDELANLCKKLGLRTSYPKSVRFAVDRAFLTEAIISVHERRKTFQEQAKSMKVLPNEVTLFDEAFIRDGSYDGSRPLAIPKLNLQYLTVGDFLWRSFILYRHEAFYGIRQNIEDSLKRLSPKVRYPTMETTFHGFSKMSLVINRPSYVSYIQSVAPFIF